jgi:hypothetical protein
VGPSFFDRTIVSTDANTNLLNLPKYLMHYYDNKIKEDEMDRACVVIIYSSCTSTYK